MNILKPYPLIEIGVNLMHKSFSEDREEVITKAQQSGIYKFIITGTDLRTSEIAANYAKKKPAILYSTAGFHPHNAKLFSKECEEKLSFLLRQPQVVAVGECGLDFDRDFSPRAIQEICFEAHLNIAKETGKPLFLHERKAHKRFYDILSNNKDICDRCVVHCFTGSKDQLKAYLDLGCYIGITGWVSDERRGQTLRDAVEYIPTDRLMLETDSPFLTPRNIMPKPKKTRNEPKYLTYVLESISEIIHVEPHELALITSQNAEKFFRL